MVMTLTNGKRDLRLNLQTLRRRAHSANPLAGETAAAWPEKPDLLRPGRVVAGYAPIRAEIDPLPLMRRLEKLGAVLSLPVAEARATPMTFRLWRPGDRLVKGALGVMEPDPWAEAVRPDLVIAPLLGFDASGARLGYGGGCYDATIAALRQAGPVFVLGLAFAIQEVEALGREPHDQGLDAILTEVGYRRFERT